MFLLLLMACVPLDGALPASTWGGPSWSLVVADDATGTLETDCALGTFLDPLVAEEGSLEVALDWDLGGGPDMEDPPDPIPATLVADVTAHRLVGLLAPDDGAWESEVDVRLGEQPVLLRCQ